MLEALLLSDLWPLLLFAADRGLLNEHPDVQAAYDSAALTVGSDQTPDVQSVAERLARAVCPSGMVGTDGWRWSDEEDAWVVVGRHGETAADSFLELGGLCNAPLSPDDPAHVALVSRVCGLALGLHLVGARPIPVSVQLKPGGMDAWVRFYRPASLSRATGPESAGILIPGKGEDGVLVFRAALRLCDDVRRALEADAESDEDDEMNDAGC